jgi:hypothetical protein
VEILPTAAVSFVGAAKALDGAENRKLLKAPRREKNWFRSIESRQKASPKKSYF